MTEPMPEVQSGWLPCLGSALVAVQSRGFVRLENALGPEWRDQLLGELEGCDFELAPEVVGQVRQRVEELIVAVRDSAWPTVARLGGGLRDALAHDTWGLDSWVPNEAVVLRYRGPAAGISPHRDHKRYRFLVAVFTLIGHAPFSVVGDRRGQEVLASWMTAPGDLCLLRGPGLGGHADGRPLHCVGGPVDGERISLAFRMHQQERGWPCD